MAWYVADGILQNTNSTPYPEHTAVIRPWMIPGWDRVEISSGIMGIGEGAFKGYKYLRHIRLNDSLESIGAWAFADSGLQEITIPRSVKHIDGSAFSGCRKLRRIVIPPDHPVFRIKNNLLLTRDGEVVFAHATAMEAEIPAGVKRIGDRAFVHCERLKRVTIPPSIEQIGAGAFEGCISLEKIELPQAVSQIGAGAFSGCISLTGMELPDGITHIEENTFYMCEELQAVHMGDQVTEIGERAFAHCQKLKQVDLSSVLCRLGKEAFARCKNLTEISIPDGVLKIEDCTFGHCDSLSKVHIGSSVSSIGYGAFEYCSRLTEIGIPQSMTDIGDYAFYCCSSLKEICFPDSVVHVGENIFEYCRRLYSIRLNGWVARKLEKDFLEQLDDMYCTCNVSKVPAAFREKAYKSFARCEQMYSESARAEHMEVIRKNSPALIDAAFDETALLRLMCREKLISSRSVDRYVDEAIGSEDVELTALVLGYKAEITGKKKRAADADNDLTLDDLW